MRIPFLLAFLNAPLLAAQSAPGDPPAGPATPPPLTVTVDSSRHETILTMGPFHLPSMAAHAGMPGMDHSQSHDTPVYTFAWPVEGWFRGFRLQVRDSAGRVLPRRLMHHLIMINYDRRQLPYHAVERLWGAGTETGDVTVPSTIGVPLAEGTKLGLYIAWHNDTPEDLDQVYLRATLQWLPHNLNPAPRDVLPLYLDVNLKVGGGNEFDLPPGPSERSWEFVPELSGRILGLSGHLHDYGREVRLEDAQSGRVLTRVRAKVRPDGKVRGMERHLFGVAGEGLKLSAGHRYRVVAEYDNPTGETLIKGAMGSLTGIFAPDDLAAWPVVDVADSLIQKDLRFLARRGGAMRRQAATAPVTEDSVTADQHNHQHATGP